MGGSFWLYSILLSWTHPFTNFCTSNPDLAKKSEEHAKIICDVSYESGSIISSASSCSLESSDVGDVVTVESDNVHSERSKKQRTLNSISDTRRVLRCVPFSTAGCRSQLVTSTHVPSQLILQSSALARQKRCHQWQKLQPSRFRCSLSFVHLQWRSRSALRKFPFSKQRD